MFFQRLLFFGILLTSILKINPKMNPKINPKITHSNLYFNLREVGVPSRNILHGRGVGSKSRIGVRRVVGSLGAFDSQNTYRNFSLESFFLGARMRDVYRNFVLRGSTS